MHEPLIKALTIVIDLNNIMAGHAIHVIGRTFFNNLASLFNGRVYIFLWFVDFVPQKNWDIFDLFLKTAPCNN